MANSPNMAAVILFNRRSINDLSFGPPVAYAKVVIATTRLKVEAAGEGRNDLVGRGR